MIETVLIGRPYSILPQGMNKGIPDMFAERGVAVWYQDMIRTTDPGISEIRPLLKEIPWEYGKRALRAAETAARTEGLYPVMVTSFKCGPDSFAVDAFKSVMDAYGKPYLILELDEHDSAVGYETRIEAAIRSFRNHAADVATRSLAGKPDLSAANPSYATPFKGKTVFFPFWDEYASPLLAASLRAAGIDARVMEETPATIRAGLSSNDGQCLPLNAIAESFMHTVRALGMDPSRCVIWMVRCDFSCNIPLYPHSIKRILDAAGGGFEKSAVYVGELSFMEISPRASIDAYLAYLFAGLIRRLSCRIRPYERVRGMTDACASRAMEILVPAFGKRSNKVRVAEEITSIFESIPYDKTRRNPLVALFGDLYVRDNRVMNEDVTGYIESCGGEVVSMPFNQYAKMIADTYFTRWMKEGRYGTYLGFTALLAASKAMEKAYYRVFDRVLGKSDPEFDESSSEILAKYGVLVENSGESAENLLKTWYTKKHFPEVSLFVQLSPVFCCAGMVTEAMNRKIEEITGVPVVSITYDGTGSGKNGILAPYLKYPKKRGD